MAIPVFSLNQIAAQLQLQWGGSDEGTTRTWTDGTIEYAMPDTTPSNNGSNGEAGGFTTMTATQKAFAREAFELWDDLIQSDLSETTSQNAQMTLSYSSTTRGNGTYATPFLTPQPPGSSTFDREIDHERIWMSTAWPEHQNNNMSYGERGFENYIHEIGHALGLSHAGSYNAGDGSTYATAAEYTQDTLQWTIMSYWTPGADGTVIDRSAPGTSDVNGDGINASTPLLHDIAAIQSKYGANFSTRSSSTVYGFHSTADRRVFDFNVNKNPVIAIWDGGGTDRLDVSGFSQNQRIDLRAGTFSDVGALTLNVAIAYNVQIEDAIGGSGNDDITGNGANNTLLGMDGNDILNGLDGNDILNQGSGGGGLYGGDGNDFLRPGPGAEMIDGGNGFDELNYSDSTNRIVIDETIGKVEGGWATGDTLIGIERVSGTNYNDSIRLGSADNWISGSFGADNLDGGGGSDKLYGEAGDDFLQGGAGADYIDGGSGFDTATFVAAVVINLQTGGRGGEVVGDTYVDIEQYNGSPDSDTFVANNLQVARFASGDGVDFLYGGDQEDWLQGGRGEDYISGGNGFDTVSYADAPGPIIADMPFRGDTSFGPTEGKITAGEWGTDTLVSMEDVEGSAFSDNLIGDGRSNKLSGLGGDDRIEGDGGSTPQRSSDILLGGTGNDNIAIGESDFAYGGPDYDTATFVGGPISLNFNVNTFTIGGQGFYMTEFENYIGSSSSDAVWGAGYGETINLGTGDDYADGQGGDDFIYAGPGADFMFGGTGYDTIVFQKAMVADWQSGVLDSDIAADSWSSWEAIQGSSGDDRIRTNSWGYSVELRGGAGNDVLATGVTGIVSDILKGEDGNDELDGGAGTDSMIGGKGNDAYYVDNISDVVTENSAEGYDTINSSISYTLGVNLEKLTLTGSGNLNGNGNTLNNQLTGNTGNNILNGRGGNDTLSGLVGNDTLNGDAGNDSLYGAAGIDQLNGGLGTDKLTSGGGSDKIIFQFGQSLVDAPDRITDFSIGFDKIDLLNLTGIAIGRPVAFFRSNDNSLATTFSQLVNQVFADVNGALAGNQALSVNQAAFVLSTNGAIAGSYLIINDNVAGFQASADLVVNITGQTGSLPTLGAAPIDTFFM